jgi:hypothetical protein
VRFVEVTRHEGCGRCNPRDGERCECCCRRAPSLPPGPAFIRVPRRLSWPYEDYQQWTDDNVPEGYRYQPATEWTGAGWVRPHGSN